jgi:hypothetical protein
MSKKQFITPIIKSKEFQGDKFPGFPVITLSEIKDKSSKMISLNEKAIDLLSLNERPDGNIRFGVTKGFVDGQDSEIVPFIYGTNDILGDIISNAGNIVSRSTAAFNFNTCNARSSSYHEILSECHSDSTTDEKYFVMVEEYSNGYWRLEEFSASDLNDEGTIGLFTKSVYSTDDKSTDDYRADIEITLG